MKKLFALLFACLLAAALCLPAFADLGEPEFNDWFVVCGLDGFDYEEWGYDPDTDQSFKVSGHLEPGVRLQVHSFSEGEYLLIIQDREHIVKDGRGFVNATETELEADFLPANQTVAKDVGKKLEQTVSCTVTADVGLMLRQGPARTFPSLNTIPMDTKLTYSYTYSYGGYNWGYVTYNGQSGWACIDYTKAEETTEAPTEAPTDETAAPASTAAVSETAQTDAAVPAEAETAAETTAGMSKTGMIIASCCIAAVLIAAVGGIILFRMKKAKAAGEEAENP